MDEKERRATYVHVEKLRAEGKVKEADALLEQIKVDSLIEEDKVDEALMIARRFGDQPHDHELRGQLQRLKLENTENDRSLNAARALRMRDARDADLKELDAAVIEAAKAANTAIAISDKFADRIRPYLPNSLNL